MKLYIWRRSSITLLGLVCLATMAAAKDVTPSEREQALRYLTETRDGVAEAVKGLSDAQWKFKPAPDRWSVAEVVEHLAVIEDLVQGILAKMPQAPAAAADRDVRQVDEMIVAKAEDRSNKAKAPEAALPAGRWTPAGSLEHYLAGRVQVAAILRSSPDLRGHVINHLAFGPLDGYEWILAVAAHSVRHTKQILEVKADPRFPSN